MCMASPGRRYLILPVAVLALALLGYASFRLTLQLPASAEAGPFLLLLAAMAGLGSLFSPCSFPLLLTLMSREVNSADGQGRRPLARFAVPFTLGATAFLLLTGVVLAIGAAPLVARLNFGSPAGRVLRGLVGLLLLSAGAWQMKGRSLTLSRLTTVLTPLWNRQDQLRRDRRALGPFLYGFGYIVAGFG